MSMADQLKHRIVYRVEKYEAKTSEEILEKGLKPIEVIESTEEAIKINLLLNEGITELINLIANIGTPVAWDNTNARLGVGDDATAPSAAQTGLLAVTNKLYKAMNATYPQLSSQSCIWQSDFIDTEAEWAWLEETISNTADNAGDNLCRQNTSLGTKPAGQTWRLTATVTFS